VVPLARPAIGALTVTGTADAAEGVEGVVVVSAVLLVPYWKK